MMTESNLQLVNNNREMGGENSTATVASAASNALNNRSSDTNLLDSCVDDDDEDDENASVNACDSSDEYAMYVDKTGRQQQQRHHQQSDASLPKPFNMNTDMIHSNVTPVPPPTAAVTPESTAHTPRADPPSPRRNVSVSPPGMDGLEFDMNQPWERSLLRQLEKPKESSAPLSNRYELVKTEPLLLNTVKPMMLLGHTESRDYAMEYDVDDNVSLETSSSCPPGRKMQFIHRSPYSPPQPRVVYHIPSSNDDDHNNYHTASYHYHHSPPPPVTLEMPPSEHPPHTYHPLPIIIGKHNNHPTAASSLTNGSYTTDDGRDDEVMMMMDDNGIVYKKIPTHLPHSVTTRTIQPSPQYLEMEASTGGGTSYGEVMDYNTNSEHHQHYLYQPNTDHIQPDPGCFCLGYNMLDYIISAAPTQQKQRTSLVLNGKKQRLSGVLRPARLPRVTESATMMEHGGRPIDNVDDHDNMTEDIDATVERSTSLSAIKKMRNVDPEGMYLPPTENYYFTAPHNLNDDRFYNSSSPSTTEFNETRREGVDL